MPAQNTDTPNEWDNVFKKTRLALGTNMAKVCEVAGTVHDENIEGISNTTLHKKTGIARDAIQKFIDGENTKGVSNPDLKTLCRLASELGIPPAFLLMSSDDWRRLLVAINTLHSVRQDAVLSESVLQAIDDNKG
jgi:transcriptional regulator with XRE-family HTH domain